VQHTHEGKQTSKRVQESESARERERERERERARARARASDEVRERGNSAHTRTQEIGGKRESEIGR
jgi:hypothetical protein